MEFIAKIILGVLATWVLTHSTTVDKEQEGPFYIYNFVRWLLQRPFMPQLVRENYDCPVCGSFWCAYAVALVVMLSEPFSGWLYSLSMLFLLTYGFHGAVIFWLRYVKIIYGVSARDT